MRSESCSFIWHPNVRSRYRRSVMAPRLPVAPHLLRVLDRARLAHHRDLDLARVLELLLDLLGDVARHDLRREVVDVLGLDHDPDLAAGLHRVDLLDARIARADLLEPLEP